jgi:hypothetical protein
VALPALLRLEDPQRLLALAWAERDSAERQKILVALWERRDPQSLAIVFREAATGRQAQDAIAALKAAKNPPIEGLCQVVAHSPQSDERTAAARLLGALGRPEATARLIQLTENAASRGSALTGLLASSEPSAKQFLATAENDPYLVASIRAVRLNPTHPATTFPGDRQHGTP